MEYLGLILELLIFAFGLYLYLFSIGKVQPRGAQAKQRSADFRVRNGWWMRIGGLAVMAIMLVNIYLHIVQLWGA
jgi:hypothetical protein